MRQETKLALEQFALSLQAGGSLREICPQCGGGSTKEKSLVVTISDSGYMLWHCHRASCGFSGKKLAWGVVQPAAPPKKSSLRPYTGPLGPLPKEVVDWLWDKYELKPETIRGFGWRWAEVEKRIYMPVYGLRLDILGHILRATDIYPVTPKVLTYKAVDEPWMAWYNYPIVPNNKETVVLVEDHFSAAKCWQAHVPAIALMGTNLGLDCLRLLAGNVSCVILALDKDAYPKAVNYAIKYKNLMNLYVWKLEKDLKYEKEQRIQEAYFDGKTDFSSGREEPQSI